MNTYNLFISHSWQHSDSYDRLVDLLRSRRYFRFRDYSVPRDDPIHGMNNDARLRASIRNQMGPCHVVVILAGMYASYSKWINIEIDLALNGFLHPKPIVAVEPWASQRTSVVVREAADRIVRWNTESVVRAIRDVAL